MQVDLVRPGQSALAWLQERVTLVKAEAPLAPVTVVVTNYLQGRFVLRQLARRGGFANVHAQRLADLGAVLAGGPGVLPRTLTPGVELGAARAAVQSHGGGLQRLAQHYPLYRELLRLFREARRQGVEALALEQAPGASEAARSAAAVYARYRELTEGYADPTRVRELAVEALRAAAPAGLREVGQVLVYLPTRLDAVDVDLLTELDSRADVTVALPWVASDDSLGNQHAHQAAERLEAVGASVDWTEPHAGEATVRVVRAPDPAEEVQEAVRRVAAALAAGVGLPKQALLYRQTEPYATLVRETLDGAGVPWAALDGLPLSETAPGRALLALLRVARTGFRREAVLAWLTALPRGVAGLEAHSSEWDRLSRDANIVRGAQQWQNRLAAYVAEAQSEAKRREAEGSAERAESIRRRADRAQSVADTVRAVAEALQPPPVQDSTWAVFADWAEGLRVRFASNSGRWPAEHERASELVKETLAGLKDADEVPSSQALTAADFIVTLEAALANRSIPLGQLGEGVVVGPVQSAVGFAFERVQLLGLMEGAFPPTPAQDAFFPEEAADPLQRRARARATDRFDFLAAFAAADGGEITLSAPEAGSGRAAFPSRWLLERATAAVGGPPLDAARFRRLSEEAHPWLRIIYSPLDGLRRAPAASRLGARRLGELVVLPTRLVGRHALAQRADLPLAAALALAEARRSDRFTAFDGNLGGVDSAKLLTLVSGGRLLSPTGLQGWATCPYSFFLESVLGVDHTEEPREEWTIGPLERGSLVHDILEQFFVELRKNGRPSGGEMYTSAEVALLERIAAERMTETERRGETGHPLVWSATRESLMADLRTFLARETEWRRESGVGPAFHEQAFGYDTADSWPAVELKADGITLRIRGRIDRVDVSADGRRAHVFDYKTGSTSAYKDLGKDPIEQGKKLQLAIYGRAVRQGLPDVATAGADYWFVSSKGEFKRVGLEGHDQAAVDARLDEGLTLIGQGIAAGVFPAVTGTEDYVEDYRSNCKWCPYDLICVASRDQDWQRKQGDGCGSFVSLSALTGGDDAAN